MNQAELIAAVADKAGIAHKSSVENVLKSLGEVAQGELAKGGEVTFPGIGKLTVKAKAARIGRNPRTGEAVQIPAKKAPHFSAIKSLKDALA